jgi:hypothetical protein
MDSEREFLNVLPLKWRPTLISSIIRDVIAVIFAIIAIVLTSLKLTDTPVQVPFGDLDSLLLFSWTTFALNILYSFVSSPSLVIRNHGIEVQYIWGTKFVEWAAISHVYKAAFQTFVYSAKFTKVSYPVGIFAFRWSPVIMLGMWSANYELAVEIICYYFESNKHQS